MPDPQARTTFERSKLRWDEIEQDAHAATLALYRDLLRLRREHPALRRRDREALHIDQLGEGAFVVRRDGDQSQDTLLIVVNLGERAGLSLAVQNTGSYGVLLDTNDARYGGTSTAKFTQANGRLDVAMSAPGVVVLRQAV